MALELDLGTKPWYYGLIIGLVLAGACVYATQYFLINDINTQIESTDKELADLAKKIQAGRSAEKKLPQFREEVKRLEFELEKLRRILPSSRNTDEIIKKMKALVDQGDFVLNSFKPGKLTPGEGEVYSEWPISVSLQGGYHNLAILFDRLSNFSRIMSVDQFSIGATNGQEDRTISANFVAKTFVYIEPKPGEENATSAKKKKSGKSGSPGGSAKESTE